MASSPYTDTHRLFVQSMLSKRIIPEEEAKELYEKVRQVTQSKEKQLTSFNRWYEDLIDQLYKDPSEEGFTNFFATINTQLETLDYALRITHREYDGSPFLTLVNVKQDPMTEVATNYSASELGYIRELIDMIVNADNEDFAISTMAAIQLGNKIKPLKLTPKETQDVLERLIEDKWIAEEESNGVYYLNTRAISELQSYLREQYADLIKECTFCLDVVTMGEYCAISQCPVRYHKYCADSQFRNTNNPVCPQCNTPWSRTNTFGKGLPPS
ncbi:Nse1 non-SMC component of SMC5-6 complex-domain-containing protein [Mycotypha africana]|uniref:Nse1 non-SMC component of SMC5-6 complex-domain-containing protein n=1 Tax=Mycotypha africana TaxID=64632 RepID=UPI00230000FB|nr:Nse1 non-SMC component of SMC5-6 complex-domain-containing protein [Mycotypha africana]KAI8970450.1 Nse1 non-SMC component of SMC5-6 complex-domain-containing protein [Mycotypha africana]